MPYIGDPWEQHEFEDMPQTGLHAETGLGNSNHTASLTLEHLWSVMKPIYQRELERQRQQCLIKVYFFMAFVYIHEVVQYYSSLGQVVYMGPAVQRCVL